jgi:hypothetical protein
MSYTCIDALLGPNPSGTILRERGYWITNLYELYAKSDESINSAF